MSVLIWSLERYNGKQPTEEKLGGVHKRDSKKNAQKGHHSPHEDRTQLRASQNNRKRGGRKGKNAKQQLNRSSHQECPMKRRYEQCHEMASRDALSSAGAVGTASATTSVTGYRVRIAYRFRPPPCPMLVPLRKTKSVRLRCRRLPRHHQDAHPP